ncbi:MAG: outer membrane lipoprotein carrier protein LolA [Bacteroidales bacterium]|nr:outer membrane lipoprotein carrier protein LolA [Bacteroidales bacterium]
MAISITTSVQYRVLVLWWQKKFIKSLTAFLIFLLFDLPLTLFSQEVKETPVKDPSKVIEQINLTSSKTNTLTADFTQVKEMSFLEEKVVSSGKFYFKKDKQLRWEYTEPFTYAIILNYDRLRIIDEGRSKDFEAGSNRMFLEISDVMTGMVNGTLLNSSQFTTTWSEATGHYLAELIPIGTTMKDYLMRIELKVSKLDFTVEELKMFERSGDFTQITFRNKKLNETIPAEIFRLD